MKLPREIQADQDAALRDYVAACRNDEDRPLFANLKSRDGDGDGDQEESGDEEDDLGTDGLQPIDDPLSYERRILRSRLDSVCYSC
ncbi:MAG: hypothetical protein ACYC6Y_32235 [Thermoguttaceae bacterium]